MSSRRQFALLTMALGWLAPSNTAETLDCPWRDKGRVYTLVPLCRVRNMSVSFSLAPPASGECSERK